MEMTTINAPRNGSMAPPRVPPLRNGDRLTREEFHRRYVAMPEVQRAELIEGVVYMPSPMRHVDHSNPNFNMNNWLGHYVAFTPGLEGGTGGTLKLDLGNEPQPDSYLIISPKCDGRVRIDSDGYIVGAPELVGETSASTVSYDLHDKLNAYRRNGVQEYVVWRVEDGAIDWFVLRGDKFERMPLSADDFLKSEVFPGLWLDPEALMTGNLARVFEVVQMGLQTVEHVRFVDRLARK